MPWKRNFLVKNFDIIPIRLLDNLFLGKHYSRGIYMIFSSTIIISTIMKKIENGKIDIDYVTSSLLYRKYIKLLFNHFFYTLFQLSSYFYWFMSCVNHIYGIGDLSFVQQCYFIFLPIIFILVEKEEKKIL